MVWRGFSQRSFRNNTLRHFYFPFVWCYPELSIWPSQHWARVHELRNSLCNFLYSTLHHPSEVEILPWTSVSNVFNRCQNHHREHKQNYSLKCKYCTMKFRTTQLSCKWGEKQNDCIVMQIVLVYSKSLIKCLSVKYHQCDGSLDSSPRASHSKLVVNAQKFTSCC